MLVREARLDPDAVVAMQGLTIDRDPVEAQNEIVAAMSPVSPCGPHDNFAEVNFALFALAATAPASSHCPISCTIVAEDPGSSTIAMDGQFRYSRCLLVLESIESFVVCTQAADPNQAACAAAAISAVLEGGS